MTKDGLISVSFLNKSLVLYFLNSIKTISVSPKYYVEGDTKTFLKYNIKTVYKYYNNKMRKLGETDNPDLPLFYIKYYTHPLYYINSYNLYTVNISNLNEDNRNDIQNVDSIYTHSIKNNAYIDNNITHNNNANTTSSKIENSITITSHNNIVNTNTSNYIIVTTFKYNKMYFLILKNNIFYLYNDKKQPVNCKILFETLLEKSIVVTNDKRLTNENKFVNINLNNSMISINDENIAMNKYINTSNDNKLIDNSTINYSFYISVEKKTTLGSFEKILENQKQINKLIDTKFREILEISSYTGVPIGNVDDKVIDYLYFKEVSINQGLIKQYTVSSVIENERCNLAGSGKCNVVESKNVLGSEEYNGMVNEEYNSIVNENEMRNSRNKILENRNDTVLENGISNVKNEVSAKDMSNKFKDKMYCSYRVPSINNAGIMNISIPYYDTTSISIIPNYNIEYTPGLYQDVLQVTPLGSLILSTLNYKEFVDASFELQMINTVVKKMYKRNPNLLDHWLRTSSLVPRDLLESIHREYLNGIFNDYIMCSRNIYFILKEKYNKLKMPKNLVSVICRQFDKLILVNPSCYFYRNEKGTFCVSEIKVPLIFINFIFDNLNSNVVSNVNSDVKSNLIDKVNFNKVNSIVDNNSIVSNNFNSNSIVDNNVVDNKMISENNTLSNGNTIQKSINKHGISLDGKEFIFKILSTTEDNVARLIITILEICEFDSDLISSCKKLIKCEEVNIINDKYYWFTCSRCNNINIIMSKCIKCFHVFKREEIIDAVNLYFQYYLRKSLEYNLECDNCMLISDRKLSAYCKCGGNYKQKIYIEELNRCIKYCKNQEDKSRMENVLRFYKFVH